MKRWNVVGLLVGAVVLLAIGFAIGHYTQFGPENQRVVTPGKAFGPWVLTCVKPPKGGKQCALTLRVVASGQKRLVMAASIMPGKNNAPYLVVLTPPNIAVASGLQLTPAGKPAMTIAFGACTPRFCRVEAPLDAKLQNAFMGPDGVTVQFTTPKGKPASIKLPTKDFGRGFEAWKAEYSGAS